MRESGQGDAGRGKMLINDNLDWGLKDMGESGLKDHVVNTHVHALSYTNMHAHTVIHARHWQG